MESRLFTAPCTSSMHASVIFPTVYPISVSGTYVQEQLNFLMTIHVLSSSIPVLKISFLNVDGLVIVRILLRLVAEDFSISYMY